MHTPAIIMGTDKISLDTKNIYDYYGNFLSEISCIPSLAIPKIVNDQRNAYIELKIDTLVSIIKKAGQILTTDTILNESPEDYYKKFVVSTGLPKSCAINGLELLGEKMKNIDKIMEYEIPYTSIGNFELKLLKNRENYLAASQFGKILGVIAPSNHPAVHISWVTALALKYSIIVKPGKDDPFTPARIIKSLLIAGLPKELISMVPMEHSSIDKFISLCDKTIVYGKHQNAEEVGQSNVILRGVGNSKVYVDYEDSQLFDKAFEVVYNSVIHDGGRRCTNASAVIVKGNAKEFAYKLAQKMNCELEDPLSITARVSCFKKLEDAKNIDRYIDVNSNSFEDISYDISNLRRLQIMNGVAFLRPTVLLCKDTSPMFCKELPFPFVTISSCEENVDKALSNSLAVSLVTNDGTIISDCMENPSIRKVIVNSPTYSESLGDPHDGYLFPELYRIKSVYGGDKICSKIV